MNPDENKENMGFERLKIEIDVVKHISTLTTGSIVIVVTLADKLPKPLIHPGFLCWALALLVVSLACCVGYLVTPWSIGEPRQLVTLGNSLVFFAAGMFLLVGIALLAIFGLVNFGCP